MQALLTTGNITFVLGVLGIMFSVFLYFKTPQTESEKKDALLAQQVQWEKESNEKRFSELSIRITESMTLAQNHIHTVDTKVDSLISSVNAMNLEVSKAITRLETTIHERFPRAA